MIEIPITSLQIERAEKLYQFECLSNSITTSKSQIYGAIGEILVFDYYTAKGDAVIHSSQFDYDFIINEKKVEIKTIKTISIPKDSDNANISAFNATQKTDIYYFVYVTPDKKKGFLCGWIYKEKFLELAELKKKGEIDKFNWVFKSDTYSLKFSELTKVNKSV